MLKKILPLALDLVFPIQCVGCGAYDVLLCSNCQTRLPHYQLRCLHKPSPSLDMALVCGAYTPLMERLIGTYKFYGIRDLAPIIAQFMLSALQDKNLRPPRVVMPIPLHRRKLARRGFNQSALLAEIIAGHYHLPLDHGLKRRRYTAAQSRLGKQERWNNLVGAFAYEPALAPKKILLIDDIATTFATLENAAAALKQRGATSIWALVASSDAN